MADILITFDKAFFCEQYGMSMWIDRPKELEGKSIFNGRIIFLESKEELYIGKDVDNRNRLNQIRVWPFKANCRVNIQVGQTAIFRPKVN